MELRFNNKEAAQLEHDVPTIKRFHKSFALDDNVFIEGDNLDALKLLQNTHASKIKMIYIDPPYNTRTKKLYKDKLCHDAWASMMYPRLYLARNLLRDDGVIFISIDDNEVHHLRMICDEIFGEGNFVAQFVWRGKTGSPAVEFIRNSHEYVLCYSLDKTKFVIGEIENDNKGYNKFDENKKRFFKTQLARKWGANSTREDRPNLYYGVEAPDGTMAYPKLPDGRDGRWNWSKNRMTQEINANNILFAKNNDAWIIYEKIYQPEDGVLNTRKYTTYLDEVTANGASELKELSGNIKLFDYPKSTSLLNKLLKISNTSSNDLILDFFSGSSTTAHAVMKLNAEDGGNRKYIMVQLPEPCDTKSEAFKAGYKTIADIGRERIRRAKEKYGFKDPDFVDVVCI